MQSVTDKVKELLTPEKTKPKLSPEREKIMRQTPVIWNKQIRNQMPAKEKRNAAQKILKQCNRYIGYEVTN